MAIFPVEDRPYFRRYYDTAIETHTWRNHNLVSYMPTVRDMLDNGPITSKNLKIQDEILWSGPPTSIARAILDLYEEGITEKIIIEGIDFDFHIEKSNLGLIENLDKLYRKRVSFIAPLDNLIWDRKFIKALFDFGYKWEVYTP